MCLPLSDDRTILDRDYGSAVGVIDRFFGTRPVYVIRANPGDLAGVEAQYRLRPVAGAGNLTVYQVLGPVGAG